MLKQIEGSRAVAEAVALCRPQVICAYPITPQAHIVEDTIISTVIAGLGGRPVTRKSLRALLLRAERGELPAFSYLDLRAGLAWAELARIRATRRSGSTAENMLRDLGVAGSGPTR